MDLSEGIIEGLQKDAFTQGCESVLKVMLDGLSNLLGKRLDNVKGQNDTRRKEARTWPLQGL